MQPHSCFQKTDMLSACQGKTHGGVDCESTPLISHEAEFCRTHRHTKIISRDKYKVGSFNCRVVDGGCASARMSSTPAPEP